MTVSFLHFEKEKTEDSACGLGSNTVRSGNLFSLNAEIGKPTMTDSLKLLIAPYTPTYIVGLKRDVLLPLHNYK